MKQVKDIISDISCRVVGSEATEVRALTLDSRRVEAGTMFFAVVGTATDGHAYIEGAIERGAVAVVCQQLPEKLHDEVCYVVVEDTSAVVGQMASNFYDVRRSS